MQLYKKEDVNLIFRAGLGIGFFVVGYNIASGSFFREYPAFGIPYLGEFLAGVIGGIIGFLLLPDYFYRIKGWLETVISLAVQRLVGDFWNQYMARMETARKERKKEATKKNTQKLHDRVKGGVLLDTSVLVDGRILQIAKTGFLPSPLIVSKTVINELQLMADNEDNIKRKKGRRGLDLIKDLKKTSKVMVLGQKPKYSEVDKELIELGKECKIGIMTLDFNLNKVAGVSGVKVLNINDLVEAVKPVFIPGEPLSVEIVQKGKEKGQGIGYLEDGTMIVVAGASEQVGARVNVVVAKLIQTSAGKMVFCELAR